MTNLSTPEGLLVAINEVRSEFGSSPERQRWVGSVIELIETVREVDEETFRTERFQRMLWDSDTMSATGMGSVKIDDVIRDPEILDVLWFLKSQTERLTGPERTASIEAGFEHLCGLTKAVARRVPRLKLLRVLASIFPEDFTTLTDTRRLRQFAKALGLSVARLGTVTINKRIVDAIASEIGRPTKDTPALADRLTLPWELYTRFVSPAIQEPTEATGIARTDEKLSPLPPERRRRGLLAIKGFSTNIRAYLDFVKDGCTREDFKAHIRSINAQLNEASINTNVSALIAEWGVLRADKTDFYLTPRGEAFLETGDPAELSDWLLTRVLGPDYILHRLRESGTATKASMQEGLQELNPGWKSNFAPVVMLNWLRHLGLVDLNARTELVLTEDGLLWANQIHWIPTGLPALAKKDVEDSPVGAIADQKGDIKRAKLTVIQEELDRRGYFPPHILARLDAGIWSHARRHFAVLSGLSGAGKTLLALTYGSFLAEGQPPASGHCLVLPVQPGWHDPSALLGYASPIDTDQYTGTEFLAFLLRASAYPTVPHTVVLDEMNLSHPEQYLAPLLSAMETGASIWLHGGDEEIGGIPPNIAYPTNLVIIGTINMDETTVGLSDKVLDRAFVTEFWDIDLDSFDGWHHTDLSNEQIRSVRDVLGGLMEALRPVRLHFGWRTVRDILEYLAAAKRGGILDEPRALDSALHSKLLPKLRGESTPRLQSALTNAWSVLNNHGLSLSASRLNEMRDDLNATGMARFWR
jgi:hypothetical protein